MDCKNCKTSFLGNFCPSCGQKSSVKRFSLSHLALDSFLKGILQLDKGFLFTLKQLLTQPGHATRAYIQGERKKYLNPIILLLAILTAEILLSTWHPAIGFNPDALDFEVPSEDLAKVHFFMNNLKIFIPLTIPFSALLSFLIFIKAKQNYAEHLVINVFQVCIFWLISLCLDIVLILLPSGFEVMVIIGGLQSLLKSIFSFWLFYQYFSAFDYKKVNLILLTILAVIFAVWLSQGLVTAIPFIFDLT